jgi:hypothetical protein
MSVVHVKIDAYEIKCILQGDSFYVQSKKKLTLLFSILKHQVPKEESSRHIKYPNDFQRGNVFFFLTSVHMHILF